MTEIDSWGVEGHIDFFGGPTETLSATAVRIATDWEGTHQVDSGPIHGSFEVAGYTRRTYSLGPVTGGLEARVSLSDLSNAVSGDVTIPGSSRFISKGGVVRGRLTVSTNEVVQADVGVGRPLPIVSFFAGLSINSEHGLGLTGSASFSLMRKNNVIGGTESRISVSASGYVLVLPSRNMAGISMYAAEGYYGFDTDSQSSPQPQSRPSVSSIQTSRDIVRGALVDKSTGKVVYADAITRALPTVPRLFDYRRGDRRTGLKIRTAVSREVNTFTKNRTAIIIAQRLSNSRHADRIIVMDRGQVVEQGTREALMAARGVYWGLNWDESIFCKGYSA